MSRENVELVRRAYDEFLSRGELEETIDAGEDCVVGLVRFRGRTPAGFDLSEFPWAVAHWIEDGLIVRTAGFLTKEQALAAAANREPLT